jgi:hypothetical protein
MDSLWFITWHFYFIFSKNFQRIEGFLAVLNVTGGNFSPKSQKLPFAVTSVDGDNYLLYYSTIDLPANVAASKCRGAKMKRNLTIDESQAEKSRMRIPMKGRIQLVSGYSLKFVDFQVIHINSLFICI